MDTIDALSSLAIFNQVIAYLFLFLGMIFEGEIVLILAGILLHLGALSFLPTVAIGLFGLISKSFIAYNLGLFLQRRFPESRFFRYVHKRVNYFLPHFEKKPFWSIFISKFLVGLNNFALIFAGYLKLKFKTYLKAEVFSNLLWFPLILSLGYFFSYAAFSITREVRKFILIILVFIILFIILEKVFNFVYEIFEEFYHNNFKNPQD